jgi:hypothetical protein
LGRILYLIFNVEEKDGHGNDGKDIGKGWRRAIASYSASPVIPTPPTGHSEPLFLSALIRAGSI